jgi:hypothetical protein
VRDVLINHVSDQGVQGVPVGYRADLGRHAGAVDLGGQVHHAQPSILRCASRLTAIAACAFWILRSAVAGMQARMIQPMNPRSRP